MRYEGRRYASVDVPVASEPLPAAAERTSHNTQLDTVKPYNREWRKVPVEAGEENEKPVKVKVTVQEPSKSSDGGWAAKLFPIFLIMFILSFSALFRVSETYVPILFILVIVSLIGIIVTYLSIRKYTSS
jgi:hypothetical protein